MDLLANELSVHEQFHDSATFHAAFSRVMAMRTIARRYGRELLCHRNFLNGNPIPGVTMQQAISGLALESKRRAALGWLAKTGPFWDDIRRHSGDEWLECRNEIVTDTAVGEAAFRKLHGVDCGLVSFSPSDWELERVTVTWRREAEELEDADEALENWWSCGALEDALQERAPPIRAWRELAETCPRRFGGLSFADDCFEPLLDGLPFARCSADRILVLLDILDVLARERDETGARTDAGRQIHDKYFKGDRALFSDSSNTEKQRFQKELTFDHPDEPNVSLFCPWHGKESHLTLRLHFSWPPAAGMPVHVVYAGPKITKQ